MSTLVRALLVIVIAIEKAECKYECGEKGLTIGVMLLALSEAARELALALGVGLWRRP